MFRFVFPALLAVLVMNSFAVAGEIVEVRVVVDDRSKPEGKQPGAAAATLPVDPPKDAKVVMSIESLIGVDGDFHAKCVIDGTTIRLKGRVKASDDGKRNVSVDFSRKSKAGGQQVSTTVVLAPDQPVLIGGLAASDGARLVVVTIKAEESEVRGKAE